MIVSLKKIIYIIHTLKIFKIVLKTYEFFFNILERIWKSRIFFSTFSKIVLELPRNDCQPENIDFLSFILKKKMKTVLKNLENSFECLKILKKN